MLVLSGSLLAGGGESSAQTPATYLVFVSDLHLGPGREPQTNAWHPFEDFRWHDAFKRFLDQIGRDGNDNTTLVMLGDVFELWQSHLAQCSVVDGFVRCSVPDCIAVDPASGKTLPDLGCSEKETVARLQMIITRHKQVFSSLASFLAVPGNRLVVVPGNHDAGLLFPSAREALLQALPQGKVEFRGQGYWTSADGEIRAEHGHAFDLANYFRGWPSPFVQGPDRVQRLWRPSGEQLVQELFNQVEAQFPIIDNLTEEPGGIAFAVEETGSKGVSYGLTEFFKLLFVKNSARQTWEFLGESPRGGEPVWLLRDWPPEWQERWNDPWFLVSALDPDNEYARRIRQAAEREIKGQRFTLSAANLSEEELKNLCNQRQALLKERKLVDRPDVNARIRDTACPQPPQTAGALLDRIAKRDTLADYLIRLRGEGPLQPVGGASNVFYRPIAVPRPPFSVFIYGHTHLAQATWKKTIDGTWTLEIVNTGAFQRVATPQYVDKLLRTPRTFSSLRPEDLPECYSYVIVDWRAERAPPKLKYWIADEKEGWRSSDSCPGMN
jgi:UDP-2,3-diacylglucosamine pyrophosphatase LpxH